MSNVRSALRQREQGFMESACNYLSMNSTRSLIPHTIFFALLFAFTFGGCKNKNDPYGAGGYGAMDGDSVYGTPLGTRPDGAAFFGANVDRTVYAPIYFSFDSFAILEGETLKLDGIARSMRGSRNTVIIAGFTDERGTEEYNRALGERRAQAVREALIQRGVSAALLQTVSFGEEEPADPGSGESAWAKNRRAEFGVVR